MNERQAQLSGSAQDAYHYALLACGDVGGVSAFTGDRGTMNDAARWYGRDSEKGGAVYALDRAVNAAHKAGIPVPFKWTPHPRTRKTLAQVRFWAVALAWMIRTVSIDAGWNAYADAPLADRPNFPTP